MASPFVADVRPLSEGISGLINRNISQKLQERALSGDRLAQSSLASRDPRAGLQVGSILQGDQERAKAAKLKQRQAQASIARTVASAGEGGTVRTLQSLIPLLNEDPDLAPLIADIQDDIARFDSNPQSVIDEYQTANAFFSDPKSFQKSAKERETEGQVQALIGAVNPETKQPFTETEARREVALRQSGIKARSQGSADITIAREDLTDPVAKSKADIAGKVATAVGAAEADTPLGAASLAAKLLAMDETKIKNEEERQSVITAKTAAMDEANRVVSQINGLLTGDRFSSGFGKLITNTPDTFRSQEAIDVIAELDQIRGLVSLESRQKLKGQGTISDSESKTLEKSATLLSNPLISDDLARKELRTIRAVFTKSAERNQLAKSTREGFLVKQPSAAPPVVDIQALTQEAEAAIAAGADREAVMQRLQQLTGGQ